MPNQYRIKDNIASSEYEILLSRRVRDLDNWFYKHGDLLNGDRGRLTHIGVLDSYKREDRTRTLDLDKTTVYYGRWDDSATFKGQAVVGIEYGLLWVIDALLDLWFKFVDNSGGELDDVIGELLALRADIVRLMREYTNLNTSAVDYYHIPASKRSKPSWFYNTEFHDLSGGDNGVVLESIGEADERLSNYDKFSLARSLAEDLGSKNIGPHGVFWYPTSEHYRDEIFRRYKFRDAVKTGMNIVDRQFKKQEQERIEKTPMWFQLKEDSPKTATAHALVQNACDEMEAGNKVVREAREQDKLYKEMRKRVQSLEKQQMEVLEEQVKAKVIKECDEKVRQAILSSPSGPLNRDIVLDSPHELITMNVFQEYAMLTANQDMTRFNQLNNAILGLAGEAGEVADLMKKRFYHPWSDLYYLKEGNINDFRSRVIEELGDVLWYAAWTAKLMDHTLGQVAQKNRAKLVERHGSKQTKAYANKSTV